MIFSCFVIFPQSRLVVVCYRLCGLSKYVGDVVVFHLRMARRDRNVVNRGNKRNTNKFSVAIAGIFERYTSMYT
jgi:hypothetical protein